MRTITMISNTIWVPNDSLQNQNKKLATRSALFLIRARANRKTPASTLIHIIALDHLVIQS